MGCDIHCYVEYRVKKPRDAYDREWRDFGGRINPGRNYGAFAALAGVRGPLPRGGVEPRGVPDDMAWAARADWWMYITDAADASNEDECPDTITALMRVCLTRPGEDTPKLMLLDELQTKYEAQAAGREFNGRIRYCTPEQAAKWHKYGHKYELRDGKPIQIEHPDWHTPSWLTPDEWGRAVGKAGPEYAAMLAAMRGLEAAGFVARVVFWFDN